MNNTAQSDTFKYKGCTIERKIVSVTQGSYSLTTEEGEHLGNFSLEMRDINADGRRNYWLMTDEEIKKHVDISLEIHGRYLKVIDFLKNTSIQGAWKKVIAKYFTSPSFPDLKDIHDLKLETFEETKKQLMGYVAFQSGYLHPAFADQFARALHGYYMRSVTVTFTDKSTMPVTINGTDDEIRLYYRIGSRLNIGECGRDRIKVIATVEFN